MEANLLLGEGDSYGQPLRLRTFQARFIDRLYEFYPDTGRRRYKRALFMLGKGNGKTPIAAAVGAAEILGPYAPISPRVTIGAASLENADLVFGDLKALVTGPDENPSPMRPYVEPFELEMLLKGRAGKAERIAAVASTNDGGRTTAFIEDELHEWLTNKQKRVHLVVSGAVAKRKHGFSLGISTAGVRGADSPLAGEYEYGVKIAKGDLVDDAFLFECYEAPDGLDLDDESEWLAAVLAANPGADPAACGEHEPFVEIEALRYRFKTIPRFEFERYHLNRWTSAVNAWIPMETWDEGAERPEIEDGESVYVAIAGQSRRDVTAVAVVRPEVEEDGDERRIINHSKLTWFSPNNDGEAIDPDVIKAHIRTLYGTYDVRQVRYPQLFWQLGEELEEEGLPMVYMPPGPARATKYSQALFDAAIERRIRHGGDPVLREHAQAAVAKDKGADGFILESVKAQSPVTGVIALGMAIEAATEVDEGGGVEVIDLTM